MQNQKILVVEYDFFQNFTNYTFKVIGFKSKQGFFLPWPGKLGLSSQTKLHIKKMVFIMKKGSEYV